jgi:hypothetical protein
MSFRDREDPLGVGRGILFGLLIGSLLWILLIGGVVYLLRIG